MPVFTGVPDQTQFRLALAIALSGGAGPGGPWTAALAILPVVGGDLTDAEALGATADIEAQLTAEALAGADGAYAYGFTGASAAQT